MYVCVRISSILFKSLRVCLLYIMLFEFSFQNVCPFDYTSFAVSGKVGIS